MTAGAITALTFRKLKQITIKESLDVGKHAASRGFFAKARFSCNHSVPLRVARRVRNIQLHPANIPKISADQLK